MSLAALTQAWADWLNANRPGHSTLPGSWYTALVSDLQADDYLHGPRAIVVSTGSTVSGVRTLTLQRVATGVQFTVGYVAASSVVIRR